METMKNDPKQPPTAAKAPHPGAKALGELRDEPGLPVYELRFRGSPGPDIPLRSRPSNGGIGNLRRTERIDIAYLPRVQFYRIVEATTEKGAKELVYYMPREWATWEPMP